jgi:DNA-binding NarL/FixJ family response regulator
VKEKMINVVLADDHAIFRDGLKEILVSADGFNLIGEVSCGSKLLELLRQCKPDVVITDINMPGISGIDLIARIHSQYPRLPILVLSMLDEPQIASYAIKAGAHGYITKNRNATELLTALRAVAGDGRYIERGIAEHLLFNDYSTGALHCTLSARERSVFDLLIIGKDTNEIAEELCISNKTVSTHKINLLKKMKMKSTAELVKYAVQSGLLL